MFFFFQAEDGIRDLVRSRGLGDVYKRQHLNLVYSQSDISQTDSKYYYQSGYQITRGPKIYLCLLYTSDAADERSSVDLGGRRIIKKKKKVKTIGDSILKNN